MPTCRPRPAFEPELHPPAHLPRTSDPALAPVQKLCHSRIHRACCGEAARRTGRREAGGTVVVDVQPAPGTGSVVH